MTQSTIYGLSNCRFYTSNPYGQRSWYPTRALRDAARERLVEKARAAGLSDPDEAFAPIKRTIRSEAARSWLSGLTDMQTVTEPNGPTHVWHSDAEAE